MCVCESVSVSVSGFQITCPGNPGHGSRFIENTAVEKVVHIFPLSPSVTMCHYP